MTIIKNFHLFSEFNATVLNSYKRKEKESKSFGLSFAVKFLILNFNSIDVKKSSDHPKLKSHRENWKYWIEPEVNIHSLWITAHNL